MLLELRNEPLYTSKVKVHMPFGNINSPPLADSYVTGYAIPNNIQSFNGYNWKENWPQIFFPVAIGICMIGIGIAPFQITLQVMRFIGRLRRRVQRNILLLQSQKMRSMTWHMMRLEKRFAEKQRELDHIHERIQRRRLY